MSFILLTNHMNILIAFNCLLEVKQTVQLSLIVMNRCVGPVKQVIILKIQTMYLVHLFKGSFHFFDE